MIGPFFEAIKQRDAVRVRTIMAEAPELVSAVDENGVSAILTAVYYRADEVLEVLLKHSGELTLHEAAATGGTERVAAILEDQPDKISLYSSDGWTALHLSAFFGRVDTARELIRQGASINARSTNGLANLALHAACAGANQAMIELLVRSGSDVNDQQHGGWTPLHSVAANGDLTSISLLLSAGADPNRRKDDQATPLTVALEKNQTEAAELLRAAGAVD